MAGCEECAKRINCDECAAAFKHIPHGVAERLFIWKTARGALMNDENTWDEGLGPSPSDVLFLAIFLECGGEATAGALG